MKYKVEQEQQLITEILSFADSPLDYVKFVFPWGQQGTPLEKHTGPKGWQRELFEEVEHQAISNQSLMDMKLDPKMLQSARSSGRGIGKSAGVGMLAHWMCSTHLGATTIVTANTEAQLRTRTWPEVGKWNTLAINSHWWEFSATALRPAPWFSKFVSEQLKIDPSYWYAQAQNWSEENPDAFAGAHNMAGLMLIFDEASGIPAPIWSVSEGFFIEPSKHRYWLVFGNGRRNTGEFFEAFHKNRNFWNPKSIDARTVEGTDQAVYQKIIDQYGEDSDVARVEVYGQFPLQGIDQFISRGLVLEAQNREVVPDPGAPLIMGVDCARQGADRSVIRWRQGRDAKSIPPWVSPGRTDVMTLANKVAEWIDKTKPDAVFIDEGGVGGGVVDILNSRGYKVTGVDFGSTRGVDTRRHFNKRVKMWDDMANWLERGAIDDSPTLRDDLVNLTYDHRGDSSQLWLETKKDMKKRGLASTDDGDSLALTFAEKVPRRDLQVSRLRFGAKSQIAIGVDDDIF